MFKRRGKAISILMVLSFLFTLILPVTAWASDAVDFTWSTAEGKDKDADLSQNLGFIKISDIEETDSAVYVEVTLPDKVEWHNSIAGDDGEVNTADDPDITNYIQGYGITGTAQLLAGDEDEYVVWFDTDGTVSDWDNFYIKAKFNDMKIGSGAPDDIDAEIKVSGVSDSDVTFTESATCLIGTAGGTVITYSADTARSISAGNEQELAEITFDENVAGAFEAGDKIILTLPNNVEWDDTASDWEDVIEGKYGLTATVTVTDDDECTIEITDSSQTFKDAISFTGYVTVFPNVDEGDVELSVESDFSSDADLDETSLVVAYVGEKSGIITVDDDQDDNVYIGQITAAALDTFTIETSGGPFIGGDKIYLTLTPNAFWGINPEELSGDWEDLESAICSADLNWVGSFNDGCSIWLEVPDGESYDEIEFSNIPIAILPFDLSMPITVTLGGTYSSEAVAVAPAPMAHADVKAEILTIDKAALNQAGGDITLTEKGKDAFKAIAPADIFNYIFLKLPSGVYFADEPSISINGEDADVTCWNSIDFDYSDYDEDSANPGQTDPGTMPVPDYDESFAAGQSSIVYIEFNDYSSDFRDNKIDTITISDIAYDLDNRYRNGGEITVSIGGALFNDWLAASSVAAQELVETPMYSVVNANTGSACTFIIGAGTYSINGVDYTMDVAPYISGDRTYLPIRYVGYALGLSDTDILWDAANQTVTLIKGDKVVQLQVGSKEMLVNGAALSIDVAPEITNDRVCLPIRFVAQVFGAKVGWDEATQTVNISM